MKNNVVIKVSAVSKIFHEQSGSKSLKEVFVGVGKKLTGQKDDNIMQKGDFTALNDINFKVKKGEFFGIVGRNGCGKSTLLKIIAGVYSPTEGAVAVNGKLTPFIELGVGFNPELSGRDNVFLNGALLGFSRKQMGAMYEDIVDFAELHKFMNTKLKHYSSGMLVRLAFSVAIRAESDILLIDEVLAVGDAAFQRKCLDYFNLLKKNKKTVIFVSHDMGAVSNYCDRGVLINNSVIVEHGSIGKIVRGYRRLTSENIDEVAIKQSDKVDKNLNNSVDRVAKNRKVIIKNVYIANSDNKKTKVIKPEDNIRVNIEFEARAKLINPVAGMVIADGAGRPVVATNTKQLGVELGTIDNGTSRKLIFEVPNYLTDGRYSVSCAINKVQMGASYDRAEDSASFVISGFDFKHSVTHLPIQLEVERVKD